MDVQKGNLLTQMTRIADALERMADVATLGRSASTDPKMEQVRDVLMEKFEGTFITVEQAREALQLGDASSKAIGMLLSNAGFERKRWSSGVRFAICEPGGTCTGAPVLMPENLEDSVNAAREAKRKHGRKLTAEGVLYGAYLMQGITAKASQVTPAHVEELRRRYPGEFED